MAIPTFFSQINHLGYIAIRHIHSLVSSGKTVEPHRSHRGNTQSLLLDIFAKYIVLFLLHSSCLCFPCFPTDVCDSFTTWCQRSFRWRNWMSRARGPWTILLLLHGKILRFWCPPRQVRLCFPRDSFIHSTITRPFHLWTFHFHLIITSFSFHVTPVTRFFHHRGESVDIHSWPQLFVISIFYVQF